MVGRIGLQGKGTSGNNGIRVTNRIFLQRKNVEGSEATGYQARAGLQDDD